MHQIHSWIHLSFSKYVIEIFSCCYYFVNCKVFNWNCNKKSSTSLLIGKIFKKIAQLFLLNYSVSRKKILSKNKEKLFWTKWRENCFRNKGGVFLKVKVKSENRPFFWQNIVTWISRLSVLSKKFSQDVHSVLFKLWRAVKKVVDFPNYTLNYKITPPLWKTNFRCKIRQFIQ